MTTFTLPPVRPTSGAALQVRLVANEAAKGVRLMWRRRAMVVVSVALGALNYLGISLFIGGGHIAKQLMVLTLPALLAVSIASNAAIQASGGIAEEINGGTLEQTQLSPAPPQLQVLGRLTALAAETLPVAAALGLIFTAGFGLHYDWQPAALAPAALTIADALVMAALTVRVASIGAITHVFNMAIMVFGGMIVPITAFPAGIEVFARFIPTALGVQALNTTLAGGSLAAIWSDNTLPWLLLHTTVALSAGLTLYAANIRRAQREGGLSPR